MDKISLVISFELEKISPARVGLGGTAGLEQTAQVFNRACFVVSRILDPRSFSDSNHSASDSLVCGLAATDSGVLHWAIG